MISSGSAPPLLGLDTCFYEQMEEAIGIYSREARVLYLNPAAERMIGRPREEVFGHIFWGWFSHRIYASGDVIYAIAVDITDQRRTPPSPSSSPAVPRPDAGSSNGWCGWWMICWTSPGSPRADSNRGSRR
ncbi:PAS domain-containing protein [Archangium minus]|uniref:PAS domain-containing protein n=1 Tax=Archangium minus TaxID=83450 RepID=A0ABY9WXM5_9BACT|nr:PAS domain-containing protein [Archangium violaceum]WNG47895.1 PAS domain-containing protein [Archangium minus]